MNGKWTSEEVRQLLLKIAGGPISVAQRVELFDIASEYAAILDAQGDGGAVELEYPEFHAQGMGCGLEDRGITDRYEAMRYGFDEALDQMARIIENAGPIYTHPARSGVVSDGDVEAACEAYEDVYEAEIHLGSPTYTDNKPQAMRAALEHFARRTP